MLDEDFDPDADEHESAQEPCAALELVAELLAQANAERGEREGDDADPARTDPDVGAQDRKADAHGQGVNAGGDGEHQELARRGGVCDLFLLAGADALVDHLAADEGQQAKGDPVVHALDVPDERAAREVPDQGHEELETAKEQTDLEGVLPPKVLERDARCDGYGEGVHRERNAQERDFDNAHVIPSLCL